MNIDKKILQARCANLLKEYDDMLRFIAEQEAAKLNNDPLKDTEFEIAKASIYNAGIKEGMRRLIAAINDYAR